MHKHIVICSDGTGNTAIKGRGTNVFKLYEAVDLEGHRTDGKKPAQIGFYDDGVGTGRLKALAILAGAFGIGLSRNVRQLYTDLARVYEPGDRLFLFGFSRGAFTVRTLSGFIAACGIMDRRHRECTSDDQLQRRVYRAYRAYRNRYGTRLMQLIRGGWTDAPESVVKVRRKWAVQHEGDRGGAEPWQVPIAFVGVWDTVDAVGFPVPWLADLWNTAVYRFKFPDHVLGPMVERARHALAIDDERHTFHPLLWDEKPKDDHKKKPEPDRIKQVWFSGVHCNVGGGYPKQGMSLVSLAWMMEEAEAAGLRFSPLDRQLYHERQNVYDKLYDSRSGLAFFYRYLPRDVDRLCTDHSLTPKIHSSAVERILHAPQGYAPGNIPARMKMVGPSMPVLERFVADMRKALGQDYSLLARVEPWIGLRRRAQMMVMVLAALVLILGVRRSQWSVSDLSVWGLVRSLGAFVADTIAAAQWGVFALLVAVAVVYVINLAATRQMKHIFSAFWFRVRPNSKRPTA